MKILGIDFGRKKIGLAIGDLETRFAEPLSVVKFENLSEALEKISRVSQISRATKVVVGVSEGKIAEETKEFGEKLRLKLNLPVEFYDETLSTYEAQVLSIEAGIRRKKRKNLEDAYAASIMLQNYLTSGNTQ